MKNKFDKKFDRATKTLIQGYDKEIIEFIIDKKINSVSPIDREINLPEKHLDSAFEINDEYILNIEFQTVYEKNIEERLLLYRCLLKYKSDYKKPVRTILVYLTDNYNITDNFQERIEENNINFEFKVIKIWELDADSIIKNKILGLLPFVPLIKKDSKFIKSTYNIIMDVKVDKEAKQNLLNCMVVFSTLIFKKEDIKKMMIPIEKFEHTDFFQDLKKTAKDEGLKQGIKEGIKEGLREGLKEGAIKAKKDLLLKLLKIKFKKVSQEISKEIKHCNDVQLIESIIEKIFEINSIDEIKSFFL